MKVAATARSERGMSMIRELKADHVFNHNAADYIEDIMVGTRGIEGEGETAGERRERPGERDKRVQETGGARRRRERTILTDR